MAEPNPVPYRRSIRLPRHNYASPGHYFVTICTQDMQHLFGTGRHDKVQLNAAGSMIGQWWAAIPTKFAHVRLDEYVVMPNHLHGILALRPANAAGDLGPPLGRIVGWFKTRTTRAYAEGVRNRSWTRFRGRLWQRNYYEHVVRPGLLERVRAYVRDNPMKWERAT